MRIWSQHWLCKHHDATKLLWKVNDEICQWNLLMWFCNLDFKRPRGTTKAFYSYGATLKKKTGRKNKGLQTKINHGNWAIFALSIAFLSISVRVDRCTFISMFSRSYTHALYISKCSTFANDKYIIAHITARHICESLL